MRLGLASGLLVLCLEPTEPDRPLFPLQSWFSAFDVDGTLTSPGDSLGVAGDPLTLSHRVVSPLSFTGISSHSSTLAWRIPWTEEPGGVQSMGSQIGPN